MKTIPINSYAHYTFVKGDGELVLLIFPEDCPGMGHRDPYRQDEGKEEVWLWVGENVTFDYGQSNYKGKRLLFKVVISYDLADGIIYCADDLGYLLARQPTPQ